MEFEIGDRVRVLDGNGIDGILGKEGIVRTKTNEINTKYGVELDEHFKFGHNLGGTLGNSNGRFFKGRHLEKVKSTNDNFMIFIGDKFKGRKAKVVQNGNTYKLVKSDGTVLYTYIPEKDISRILPTSNKTEKMYIELFVESIREFKANQEKE